MKKYIANIITSFRIFCSFFMMLFPTFSTPFYITYLLCGFSDMVDGTIARKTNSTSEIGAKLDTVADFIFVTVSLIKMLPILHIPQWLWIWLALITAIKINNIIRGLVRLKTIITLHTLMNKITGVMMFFCLSQYLLSI